MPLRNQVIMASLLLELYLRLTWFHVWVCILIWSHSVPSSINIYIYGSDAWDNTVRSQTNYRNHRRSSTVILMMGLGGWTRIWAPDVNASSLTSQVIISRSRCGACAQCLKIVYVLMSLKRFDVSPVPVSNLCVFYINIDLEEKN